MKASTTRPGESSQTPVSGATGHSETTPFSGSRMMPLANEDAAAFGLPARTTMVGSRSDAAVDEALARVIADQVLADHLLRAVGGLRIGDGRIVEHLRQVAAEGRHRARVDEPRRLARTCASARAAAPCPSGSRACRGRNRPPRRRSPPPRGGIPRRCPACRRPRWSSASETSPVTAFTFLQVFNTRRKCAVQQRDRGRSACRRAAARQQRAREPEAEEPAAAGDEDLHAGILAKNASTSASSRVCFIGGRLARIVRP